MAFPFEEGKDRVKAEVVTDTDLNWSSPHHTLGKGPTQAAPGNHVHTTKDITDYVPGSGGAVDLSLMAWTYDTSTVMADPGVGKVRADTPQWSPSNSFAISTTTNDGQNATPDLAALTVGDIIYFQEALHPNNWGTYIVNAATTAYATWFLVPVVVGELHGGALRAVAQDVQARFLQGVETGGSPPTGDAGGDLSGTYPNPQIATGVVVNADVSPTAAIEQSKIQDLTAALAEKATPADISNAISNHTSTPDQHAEYLKPSEILAGDNITVDTATTPGSVIINGQAAGGGTTDHGALTGLSDDDHPQYLKPSEVLAGPGISVNTVITPGSVIIESEAYTASESDDRYVNIDGDTMTGNLTVQQDMVNAFITAAGLVGTGVVRASGPVGTARGFEIDTLLSPRWKFTANVETETGANAGSNFTLVRYNDAGVYIDTVIWANRATGLVNIPKLEGPRASITPTAPWADFGAEYAGLWVSRSGDVVTVEGLFKNTVAVTFTANTKVNLGTIPAGFRPRRQVVATAQINNLTIGPLLRMDVTPAGVLSVQSFVTGTLAINNYVAINSSYRAEDF